MSSEWHLQNAIMAYHAAAAAVQQEDPDAEMPAPLLATVGDVEDALRVIVAKVQDAQDMSEAARKRASDAGERARRFDARAARLKGVILACMDAMAWRKREWPEATVSVRQPQPGVLITDEAALEERFIRVTSAPDKDAIRTALKDGEVIEGAELANGAPTLTIRGT